MSIPSIVDLSLAFHPNMRGVELEPARTIAEHSYNTTTVHLYSSPVRAIAMESGTY